MEGGTKGEKKKRKRRPVGKGEKKEEGREKMEGRSWYMTSPVVQKMIRIIWLHGLTRITS